MNPAAAGNPCLVAPTQRVVPPGERVRSAVTTGGGVLAAVLGCAFLVQGLSRSTLPVADSLISELEARNQADSGFFRTTTLMSGVAAVVFAVRLRHRIPPGALGTAASCAVGLSGIGAVADALMPMDCAPSVDSACRRLEEHGRLSWPHQAHTWSSVLGTVAVLASLWLLGRHLRREPEWRMASALACTGGGWLIAFSCVVAVMTLFYLPGVGVAQRIQVGAFSVWLAVLALTRAETGAG